jgi:AcrR family transcriptional regulator
MAERRDVIKNKKAILQGYIDMTGTKIIDKITVSDVIKKANVSRATFYAHYKDINALKEQFETDFMQMMMHLNEESISKLFIEPDQSVYNIFCTFDKNKKMIRSLSGNGSSESFFLRFKSALKEEIQKVIHTKDKKGEGIVAFTIASILTDNCRDIVLSTRKSISNEDRATIISKFIPKK